MNHLNLFLESIKEKNFDKWNNSFSEKIILDFKGSNIPLNQVNSLGTSIRLDRLVIVNGVFEKIRFSKVEFYLTKFIDCTFRDCTFRETSFVSTTFEKCNLLGSEFDEINFKYKDNKDKLIFNTCNFNKSKFKEGTFINGVDFHCSSFVKTSFLNCTLSNSKFYGTSI